MNYKVTAQFPRGEEKLLAAFDASQDATFFLTQKIAVDELQAKKKLYRLYDDTVLLRAFNPLNISVDYAKYAEGNSDFINQPPFLYKLTIQTIPASKKRSIAYFNDIDDANLFIAEKCKTDSTVNDSDLFCIFKGDVLIKSLNKIILANQKTESSGSRANQASATFNPTPMPTRPTPPGGPNDCWIEIEDDNS